MEAYFSSDFLDKLKEPPSDNVANLLGESVCFAPPMFVLINSVAYIIRSKKHFSPM